MARKRKGLLARLILFVVGLALVVLLCVFLVGVIWTGPLVKKAIEVYGPEALGAEVKVEKVSIGLFGATARARGVLIGNPEGWVEPHAMRVGTLEVRLRLRSLFTQRIVIEDILLEGLVLTYEKGRGTNNIAQLQANAAAWGEKLKSGKEGPSKQVVINRLRVRNGLLRVKLPHLPAVPIDISHFERRHIGGSDSGGVNFGQATRDVLGSLQDSASGLVRDAGDGIEEAARAALRTGKSLGGKTLDAGGKVLEDAGQAVKGLFGN